MSQTLKWVKRFFFRSVSKSSTLDLFHLIFIQKYFPSSSPKTLLPQPKYFGGYLWVNTGWHIECDDHFVWGRSLMLPLRGSAYEQFVPIIQSALNCLVLNASFAKLLESITSSLKSEPFMIWSTVKNNILSTKWLFFSGTFKKTKYFGSQNSSNHLSEVAVEKKLFGFPHVFWK